MSANNEPIYHHFVPQFYLRRWANAERKVCRFSRPYDKIIPKMTPISGTVGKNRLYELKTALPGMAQAYEKGPMKAIDTAASRVLDLLESGKLESLTLDQRKMWAGFLMSMLMRGPKDIDVLKAQYAQEWQGYAQEIVADVEASENENTRAMAENVPAMLALDSPLLEDFALEMAVVSDTSSSTCRGSSGIFPRTALSYSHLTAPL